MSFAVYQRCITVFARQASSKKYIRRKQVKDRWSNVFCLLLSLSFSFITFFSAYLFQTTNSLEQQPIFSGVSQTTHVLWLASTMMGYHQPFYSKQMLFLSKEAVSDWLAAKKFPYIQEYTWYIKMSCQFKIACKTSGRQKSMMQAPSLWPTLC